ncbi:apoptosis-resistant E3 ubiquitin protein ligase 1-like [Saccostrea echinata]|uniref:apoptosis-resistant E3 ubiquitin protein ligase 1-like n=1 Tax=Saccostrea echinata TaxID=191078 RepID=UPI002A81A03B|nr:apoptosis-resistant E3 ubiquitin protein ligase 1-like [Saccostrea echinata]
MASPNIRYRYTTAYIRVLVACVVLYLMTLIFGRGQTSEELQNVQQVEKSATKESETTILNVDQWLDKQEKNYLKDKFAKAGILEEPLDSLNLKDVDHVRGVPETTINDLKSSIINAKDVRKFVIWLKDQRLHIDLVERLTTLGVTDFDKLALLTDAEISQIGGTCSVEELQHLKQLVKTAQSLTGISNTSNWSALSWILFIFKIVLTLVVGISVLIVVVVMDCIRSFATDVRNIRIPRYAPGYTPGGPSVSVGDGKNWLWKLFFSNSAHSLASQFCSVKWHWEEPHLVGNTMSFTVKLYRKSGKPYVTSSTNSASIVIQLKNEQVACTKQLDTEDTDQNAIKTSFTVHKSGSYKISIMVSGRHVKGSPFTKRFEPGPIDAGKSGFTNYCSTIVCSAGMPYPLTIETQDSFGNPAVYKADQNNYFKIKVIETESSRRYFPATQMIYNPDKKHLTMHIKMEQEGHYQATVSYGDAKLKNGEFSILVINEDDMTHVNKNLSKKQRNIWYEARLLSGNGDSGEKAKKVYVYISPKQLTLKEYYLKVIGKKLYTWRVCPGTKFYFNGYNSRYDAPVMTIYDCSQPHVTLAAKDRNIIAATFTSFMQRNIGGSETFQDKQTYFCQEVRKFQKSSTTVLKIDRSQLLQSSYRATKSFDCSDWYKNFQITFTGEQGLDWGGLRREWFELLCRELFDPANSDFFHRFTSDTQGLVHPNGKRSVTSKLKYFEFAGKIVGKCLFDSAKGSGYRQLVKATFSRSFLAQLIGLQVNYKYFEMDDPELYKTKVKYILENDIEDMDLTFSEEEYSAEGHLMKVVDLVPNGYKMSVTNDNKLHYLNSLAQYRLVSSCREEVEAFLKGLNLLIPDNLLSIFDENELELLMCGTGNYSVTDFKAHAVIDGTSYSFFKVLDWFWTVVDSFTEEQMARLLQFTTGCSQLPAGGFADLNPKFQISFAPTYNTLPTAHTCFNQLCLPDYDSMESLHRSILIAINEGFQGFGLV